MAIGWKPIDANSIHRVSTSLSRRFETTAGKRKRGEIERKHKEVEAASREVERRRQKRATAGHAYSKVVADVLWQLRAAAYPPDRKDSNENYPEKYFVTDDPDHGYWTVTCDYYQRESFEGISEMVNRKAQLVTVEIEFNESDDPTAFLCKQHEQSVRAGLTREALIDALKRLFAQDEP